MQALRHPRPAGPQPALWREIFHGGKVFDLEKKVVHELSKQELADHPDALLLIGLILDADRALADAAIDSAIANSGRARQIAGAQDHLAGGDAARTAGDWEAAVEQYKHAWMEAHKSTR